ncbi:condensation domain-containing protein, partial [Rhizobacter sp. Root1221]|uniref:condensation domain-containing protein n=1 Tax=Rhizobacter sp. Root1221 TaxID=1736433 RepID=UPI0012F956BB
MSLTKRDIAERFARLPAEKQQGFLKVLRTQGIDFSRLPIVPAPAAERMPVSHAQARQWFLWQLDRESSAYHIPGGLRLSGPLDLGVLRSSLAALVSRHAGLRTVFTRRTDGQAEQVVLPALELDVPLVDLSGEAQAEHLAQAHAKSLVQAPFDLTAGPLLRVKVIRVGEREHVLVLVMHHIVSDGWSMGV